MNFTGDCFLYAGYENGSLSLSIITILIFSLSLILNISALVIGFCTTAPGPMKMYLINLIVSDLIFTATLPLRIDYYYYFFNWRWGEIACRLTSFLSYINIYVSINFMTWISVNRYYAVTRPHKYNSRNNIMRAKIVCVCTWVIILVPMSSILFVNTTSSDHETKIRCMEYNKVGDSMYLRPWVTIVMCFVGFVIPLAMMSISYSAVCYTVLSGISKSTRSSRTCKLVACILAGFVICFLPYHGSVISYMMHIITAKTVLCENVSYYQMLLHATQCLMNLNCCIDPIIYFFISSYKFKGKSNSIKLMFK
ncbi:G-protein-coupled receptor family protein [Pigeonpox virus]|uniref:G-protein-coupled receptor family protein n=1 Tax=Pigeonpox virus TaxID=10264 RepID=A0A068EEV1_9POXV|nr:G-protein-coupled receptor family protein [Pigeonpox virus]AID46711.1 G-protein-coupled receptor family protein [Pigeonpox virus]WCL40152.1 G-protein-coupled receptor family protein [Pigeonpox virus]